MNRTVVNIVASLLAFVAGLVTATLNSKPLINDWETTPAQCPPATQAAPVVNEVPQGVMLGESGLKIVSDYVKQKSELLRYDIDISYPQVVGSYEPHIQQLNKRIKDRTADDYRWSLDPTEANLEYYRNKWPEFFNYTYLDYEVKLATDSVMSIYFNSNSHGLGAAHAVQTSYVVNYDFRLRKQLSLPDIFRPNSKYLDFISKYCLGRLVEKHSVYQIQADALTPKVENFDSWTITREGISFHFDECEVFSCSENEQKVDIPFVELKPLLNPSTSVFAIAANTSAAEVRNFDDFVDESELAYAGYEISTPTKQVRIENYNEPINVTYAVIKKNGTAVNEIDGFEKEHHPLGADTEFGLYSFLGRPSKQLFIEQTQWRGWTYTIADLSPAYRVVYDSRRWGVGRELTYRDIDGDGVQEIWQSVMGFTFFEGLTNASSHVVDITFKYDPRSGQYLPANQQFTGLSLTEVDTQKRKLHRADEHKFASDLLKILLAYIYAGQEERAWEFYDQEYTLPNKKELKRKIKAKLNADPVYRFIYLHER